jgi:ubiquitin-protein ligase
MDPSLYRSSPNPPNHRRPALNSDDSPPPFPSPLQEEREQALRDYKVTIEYKHLKSHAPGGVYLIPSMNDLRHFYGVIFVRRGHFTNGIFKFQLRLPPRYNDVNMWPQIVFTSYVFNPYVDAKTGELDIKSTYTSWDPSRHYLVTVLTFLKKIFYAKTIKDATANPEAKQLMETDPEAYQKKVDACVRESQKDVYANDPGCTARFIEEALAHRVLIDLLKQNVQDPAQVSKAAILSMIDHASKV